MWKKSTKSTPLWWTFMDIYGHRGQAHPASPKIQQDPGEIKGPPCPHCPPRPSSTPPSPPSPPPPPCPRACAASGFPADAARGGGGQRGQNGQRWTGWITWTGWATHIWGICGGGAERKLCTPMHTGSCIPHGERSRRDDIRGCSHARVDAHSGYFIEVMDWRGAVTIQCICQMNFTGRRQVLFLERL